MDKIREKKPFYQRYWIALSAMFLVVAVTFFHLFFRDTRTQLNVNLSKIVVSVVKQNEFQEYIPIQGKVLPVTIVYLDAIEGGRVEQKYVEAGAWVKKGDSIVRLSNTSLILNMMQREAEYFARKNSVEESRLSMEQHQLNYRNQWEELNYQSKKIERTFLQDSALFVHHMIPENEYVESKEAYEHWKEKMRLTRKNYEEEHQLRKTQVERSDAFLLRMEKNLELINEKIDALTIRAPIRGQLTSLMAEVGESKQMGQRLGQIHSMDELKVLANIDEHYVSRVQQGKKGTFDFDGTEYELLVSKILPDVQNGMFEAELRFQGAVPQGILVGQTLHIKLAIGAQTKQRVLTLSRGGFYQSTGGKWIYVLSQDGKQAEKRKIQIGRQNAEVFEVLSGLKSGEKVITSGYESFKDIEVLNLED